MTKVSSLSHGTVTNASIATLARASHSVSEIIAPSATLVSRPVSHTFGFTRVRVMNKSDGLSTTKRTERGTPFINPRHASEFHVLNSSPPLVSSPSAHFAKEAAHVLSTSASHTKTDGAAICRSRAPGHFALFGPGMLSSPDPWFGSNTSTPSPLNRSPSLVPEGRPKTVTSFASASAFASAASTSSSAIITAAVSSPIVAAKDLPTRA
mmetsp:Transcript_8773/g.32845  ORF Transcript_8773/g.32845 Transcript_8773/m.32845 type:complete len:209 (-) Transcript_8773:893-1519(-)